MPSGPVDGPAIFNDCSGGQVAVACQQFQAKNCTDVEFGAHPVTPGQGIAVCEIVATAL